LFAERVALLGVPLLSSQGVACATEQRGVPTLGRPLSDRPVAPGQLVALDVGVLYAGYEGGLARTWPAGALDRPDSHRDLAVRCWRALDAMVEQCRAGRSGRDLAGAWSATGEPAAPIAFAYGLGLGAEPPLITSELGHDAVLQSGDVLAVQAWVPQDDLGGHLARELVVVKDGAPEPVSRFRRL
jgi:Xaa-Pro aminopeptidase